jgi:hypothetical protein
MNKIVIFLAILFFASYTSVAQSNIINKNASPTGKNNSIAVGPATTAGSFSNTHSIGFHIDYYRTNNRLGSLATKPSRPIGLLFNAGMNYFLGKKETVSSYPYSYPGYALFYGTAGLIVNPIKQGNFTASTGPGIRLYNGTSSFALYTKITASYFFHQRIAVTPSVSIINESGSKPLLAAGLSACFTF